MRRVVSVTPRNTVERNIVLIIAESTHRGFGLTQAGAVGRIAGHAGRHIYHTTVFCGRGHRAFNKFARDDGLRLGSI